MNLQFRGHKTTIYFSIWRLFPMSSSAGPFYYYLGVLERKLGEVVGKTADFESLIGRFFFLLCICLENIRKSCHCAVESTSSHASFNPLFRYCNGIMCRNRKAFSVSVKKHLLFQCLGFCKDLNHDRGCLCSTVLQCWCTLKLTQSYRLLLFTLKSHFID